MDGGDETDLEEAKEATEESIDDEADTVIGDADVAVDLDNNLSVAVGADVAELTICGDVEDEESFVTDTEEEESGGSDGEPISDYDEKEFVQDSKSQKKWDEENEVCVNVMDIIL